MQLAQSIFITNTFSEKYEGKSKLSENFLLLNTLDRVQVDIIFFEVVPIELYVLSPTHPAVLEDMLEPIFWHRLQNLVRFLQNYRWWAETLALQLWFHTREKKKSHGAKSGLYGRCGTHSMLCWAKYWATTWGHSLSWYRRQPDGCNSRRFCPMCSDRVFKIVT